MREQGADNVTRILDAVSGGDETAAERLLPLVYDELRRLAAARMAREAPGHTLQPTALVHEAYLRLVGDTARPWSGRGHFFAAAAESMRRILIERARRHRTPKHGGDRQRVPLEGIGAAVDPESIDVLALDDALTALEQRDGRMSQVVKLRFFAGLTIEDTAAVLGITVRTASRDWVAARTWLWQRMAGPETE